MLYRNVVMIDTIGYALLANCRIWTNNQYQNNIYRIHLFIIGKYLILWLANTNNSLTNWKENFHKKKNLKLLLKNHLRINYLRIKLSYLLPCEIFYITRNIKNTIYIYILNIRFLIFLFKFVSCIFNSINNE